LIAVSYIFNIDKVILKKVSNISTTIQDGYIYVADSVNDYIDLHFNQAKMIKKLKYEVLQNKKYKIIYQKNAKQNKKVDKEFLNIVKVISYVNFDNFSKVILQNYNQKENTIFALITDDGFSAGIAVYENSKTIGLLNHNKKSNYAVFIGENQIPGITHGNYPSENITIKYIPSWKNIKIGDEVITSGMDNIFYKGVKVGRVVDIEKNGITQEAIVKPYANVYDKDFFYIYRSLKQQNISRI
jgi:rod shape-determining protein MreC